MSIHTPKNEGTNANAFPQAAVPQIIKKPELAKLFRVSGRTVDKWIAQKTIPFLKIGGAVRFDVAEVTAALSRFTVTAVTLA